MALPVSTELFKIKGNVKKTWERKTLSDHLQGILAPSFHTAPLWVVWEVFLNHSNIEAVPNKRQPGDSPRTTKLKPMSTSKLLRLERRYSCRAMLNFEPVAPPATGGISQTNKSYLVIHMWSCNNNNNNNNNNTFCITLYIIGLKLP